MMFKLNKESKHCDVHCCVQISLQLLFQLRFEMHPFSTTELQFSYKEGIPQW